MLIDLQNQDCSFNKQYLKFDDPKLESKYIAHHNERALPGLRLAISLFIAFIAIPTLVELYGFFEEGFTGFDSYLGILPYRLFILLLLFAGYRLSFYQPAITYGQPLVFSFSALLFLAVFLSQRWYGPWILLATPAFNFGVTLVLLGTGLLIRFAMPLVTISTLIWVVILMNWLDNAFSAAFLSLATLLMMVVISHSREKTERVAWSTQAKLAEEKRRTEKLLLNVLPASIANRMRNGEVLIADKHDNVAVLFADIVNFTVLSASIPPEKLVEILDDIFRHFDKIAEELNLEKIKTIGDAYMMAAGLPVERPVNPVLAAEAACRMRDAVKKINQQREIDIDIRIGIHLGEVVAGVIGESKFAYDLWGDVVNTASRMETTAPNGEIQVTDEMHNAISEHYDFEERKDVEIKGKGIMRTWILKGATIS